MERERTAGVPGGGQGEGSARAGLWIVGGMALIATSDNFVHLVADRMGLWQFLAVRALLVLPLAVLFAAATGPLARLRPRAPWRVVQRSAFHIAALLLYFSALPAVGISAAAAGLFSAPVWAILLGALAFGETVGPRRVAAGLLGFAGVALVLGLHRSAPDPMGLAAVAAGFCYAMGVIWTRRHCRGEDSVTLAVWQFAGFVLVGGAGLLAVPLLEAALAGMPGTAFVTTGWRAMDATGLALVVGIGLAAIIATGCLATGYKRGDASLMGLFDYSFLVWAPLAAWAVWGETPDPRVALGMGLIAAAGVLAVWSGHRRARGGAR
jgi:drug/metabolite transporter (DMT)-like permease